MNDQFEQQRRIAEERREAEKARKKAAIAKRDAALKATPLESRAVVRARTERFANVAYQIHRALKEGKPFHWKGSESHLVDVAASMGLTIITRSRAEKAGYTLKRGQKPVGTIYFGAPISKTAAVYVLECQFNRVEGKTKDD